MVNKIHKRIITPNSIWLMENHFVILRNDKMNLKTDRLWQS
jgi:hypothetical protein